MNLNFRPALAKLMEIKEAVWSQKADIDIYAEYLQHVMPLVPLQVISEVRSRLSKDDRVVLHTRHSQLFKRETSVLTG